MSFGSDGMAWRSLNAPFTEVGFSLAKRDIETLFLSIQALSNQLGVVGPGTTPNSSSGSAGADGKPGKDGTSGTIVTFPISMSRGGTGADLGGAPVGAIPFVHSTGITGPVCSYSIAPGDQDFLRYNAATKTWGPYGPLLSVKGDLLTHNGSDLSILGIGNSGQVLTVSSGAPAWVDVPATTLFGKPMTFYGGQTTPADEDIIIYHTVEGITPVNTWRSQPLMSGRGTLLTRDATKLKQLTVGTDGQVLRVSTSDPAWVTPAWMLAEGGTGRTSWLGSAPDGTNAVVLAHRYTGGATALDTVYNTDGYHTQYVLSTDTSVGGIQFTGLHSSSFKLDYLGAGVGAYRVCLLGYTLELATGPIAVTNGDVLRYNSVRQVWENIPQTSLALADLDPSPAGTYGASYDWEIPVITVDIKGRITSASTVTPSVSNDKTSIDTNDNAFGRVGGALTLVPKTPVFGAKWIIGARATVGSECHEIKDGAPSNGAILWYKSSETKWNKLAPSTSGDVLQFDGSALVWGTVSGLPTAAPIATTTYSTAGSGTHTYNAGTKTVLVVLVGGGGGGGHDGSGSASRGGGGGGAGARTVALFRKPGASSTYVVGAGGSAGTTNSGGGGTASTFASSTVAANGGNGGRGGGDTEAGAGGYGGAPDDSNPATFAGWVHSYPGPSGQPGSLVLTATSQSFITSVNFGGSSTTSANGVAYPMTRVSFNGRGGRWNPSLAEPGSGGMGGDTTSANGVAGTDGQVIVYEYS